MALLYHMIEPRPLTHSDNEEIELLRKYNFWNSEFSKSRGWVAPKVSTRILSRIVRIFYSFYKTRISKTSILGKLIQQFVRRLFRHWFTYLGGTSGQNKKYLTRDGLKSRDLGFGIPTSQDPEASIIIPCHNKWEITYKCLLKLQSNQDKTRFEIILVDDGSTDETKKWIHTIRGVRVLRIEENIGYLHATNLGASFAKSDFLVLLNNDTEPISGWLDELINVLKRDTSIAICGSTLLYPDGSLQESGGQVFSNGNAWNLGKGSNPLSGEFQNYRQVDYCSAASFAVRKRFWTEVKGFDIKYSPAYYEDTDLCLKAWSRGYKVIVSPRSWVIHHEGASHGTSVEAGGKSNQLRNKEKFLRTWESWLNEHWNDVGVPRFETTRDSKGIVIVIDEQLPSKFRDSGSLRTFRLCHIMLDLGYHVVLGAYHANITEGQLEDLRKSGIEVHCLLKELFDSLTPRVKRITHVWLLRENVILNHLKVCRDNFPDALLIADLIDLEYSTSDQEVLVKDDLIKIAMQADKTVLVSPMETKILKEKAPGANILDLWKYFEITESNYSFEQREGIVFVGSFRHSPNLEGLYWFLHKVLPELNRIGFKESISIVGTGLEYEHIEQVRMHNVSYRGYVENIREIYDSTKLAIVPLLSGRGLKGKLAEALSYGVPVVSTTKGVEGFPNFGNAEIFVSDDPEIFAEYILRLTSNSNDWSARSKEAIRYIQEHYSRESLKRKIESQVFNQQ